MVCLIWRLVGLIESSSRRQRRAPVGHQFVPCLEWHGRRRETDVKGYRKLPVSALPEWCGVFGFTYMINAWFMALICSEGFNFGAKRTSIEGVVWAMWAYTFCLKQLKEPSGRLDRGIVQRYRWFQNHWKATFGISVGLLGCQTASLVNFGRQSWRYVGSSRRVGVE